MIFLENHLELNTCSTLQVDNRLTPLSNTDWDAHYDAQEFKTAFNTKSCSLRGFTTPYIRRRRATAVP